MSTLLRTAVLTGPTAAGKTALAFELAHRIPGLEIVNADSLLVYRGMNIGTAKPSPQELAQLPHHLIDIRNPDEPFTAGDFVRETRTAIDAIHARGGRALIVGGTGFYLKALFFGLWSGSPADPEVRARLEALPQAELYSRLERVDQESALRITISDRYRLVRALELLELTGKTPTQLQEELGRHPDPALELWVVDRSPDDLEKRISARCEAMLQAGMIDEVRDIRMRFPGARALGAVGYKEVCAYLDGISPPGRKLAPGIEGLRSEIELSTRQLVKRQRTWFKSLKTQLGDACQWIHLPQGELGPHVLRLYGSRSTTSPA